MHELDFSRLYTLDDAFVYGTLRASADEDLDSIVIHRAEKLPSKPVVFRHFMGGRPRDLVGSGDILHIMSERVISILRAGPFTGWTTYPIELYGKKGERIEGYHGFAVTGRCGRIQWRKGKKVRKPAPVPGGQPYDAWVGMYFNPKSWDGSDIFVPKGMTCTIMTEPVMQALAKAKVTNIDFTRLTEFERS